VTFYYALQNRLLESDCELPFLSPAMATGAADIELRLVSKIPLPEQASTCWYDGPSLTIDQMIDGTLLVRFEDSTTFLVSGEGRLIRLLSSPPQYTNDDVAAYALGPVIAIALHLRGAVLLHAATAVMKAKAVLFAGDGGSGKSTIAAVLSRSGFAILSDDITEVQGVDPFWALASIPALRLWPDIVHSLFGARAVFPDRAPSWDKKLVRIEPSEPAAIAAVLFLESRTGEARIDRLSPRDALVRLLANIYTAKLPGARAERNILEMASALADRVPMYSFAAPPIESASRLGEFLEYELEADLQ